MHSAEEHVLARDEGDTGRDIGRLMERLPDLVGNRWQGRELAMASYLPLRPAWQPVFERLRARVAARPAGAAVQELGDKTAMRAWFQQLGVAAPPSTVVADLDFRALRGRFGTTFVVQRPRGSSGRGTYLVDGEESMRRIPPGERWLVSEYAGDTTLNYHCLVAADGAPTVLRPSLQLTNPDGIGSAFGWYSGCDYRAPGRLAPGVLARSRDMVERVGWGLSGLGYRGVFGVDIAVRGESVLVLEMNCRIQGSTWLLGELELEEGCLPTMLRHVLEDRGLGTAAKNADEPADAVQIVLRHTGPPRRLSAVPADGRYELDGSAAVRRGRGYGLLECGSGDCVLVGVPKSGLLLGPGAPLGRLISRRPLTTPDGTALTSHGRALVDAVRGMYTFEPDTTTC
ncbi:ATP-grasp domain-containing protein [Kitasatospora sp. NBC_01300]|uniref:ATP-grasp domain-containing protein n=1 Tax=Kitasatospora sp. NBC_01300 TaxID=2903574 RepID=UPI00352E915E|nr:ATP-grasp domain-containing protein [Kitasatospora sp. NBC_01300]